MKTRNIIHTLVLFAVCASLASCEMIGEAKVLKYAEDLPYLGLKGEIDSVDIRTYQADEIAGKLNANVPLFETQYYFDANGYVVKKIQKDYAVMTSLKTEVSKIENGRITEYVEMTGSQDTSIIRLARADEKSESWVDTAHDHGDLYTDTISVVYTDNARIATIKTYNGGQMQLRSAEEIFNSKGQVIQNIVKAGAFESRNIWQYDSDGNIKSIERKTTEEYVLEGSNEFKKEEVSSKTVTYAYKYDDKGNWIQAIEFDDKKPSAYIQRNISYRK